MHWTSAAMSDGDFLAAIESCSYPMSDFHHAEHLRLGWLLLAKTDLASASTHAARTIQRLAQRHGKAARYHETLTQAWMRLLSSHDEQDFCDFLARHGDRASPDLPFRYWRRETLSSDYARSYWVEPDLEPLPPLVRAISPNPV
jgi:hypothetical protein